MEKQNRAARGGNNKWEELDWHTQVTLCEQGRANENSLLHNYYVMFIALEAILFAAIFVVSERQFWDWLIALLGFVGLILAFFWWHVCELRGSAVDRWEELLSDLWQKASNSKSAVSELAKHYAGAVERRKKRREGGRLRMFLGWGGARRFLSARWVLTTFLPSLIAVLWICVLVMSFDP